MKLIPLNRNLRQDGCPIGGTLPESPYKHHANQSKFNAGESKENNISIVPHTAICNQAYV